MKNLLAFLGVGFCFVVALGGKVGGRGEKGLLILPGFRHTI